MRVTRANDSIDALAGLPDDRLVEMVRAGQPRAFDVIVHRYSNGLARYCARLGLADSRAEDVLQTSFMSAWSALARGTEVRDLSPWLYRIVHNTALNVIRASPSSLTSLGDADGVDALASPDADVERGIAVRAALAEVAALPPMQRDALLMSAVDGRTREEVASALGVSDGAVRGLLYRARATLRAGAAALAPQPLIRWAYGQLARHASGTGGAAEISTQGTGVEVGANLMKGVAIAAIALGGGAAAVTLHEHHRHASRSASVVHVGQGTGRAPSTQLASVGTVAHTAHERSAGGMARTSASAPSPSAGSSLGAPGRQGASTPANAHAPAAGAPGSTGGPAPAVSNGAATTQAHAASGPTAAAGAPIGSTEAAGPQAPETKPEGGSTGQEEPVVRPEEKSSGSPEEKTSSGKDEEEHGGSDDPEGSEHGGSDDPEGSGDEGSGGSDDHEREHTGEHGKSDDGEGGDSEHGGSDDLIGESRS
jgi:RNA polymerase sigma factor (sigma-70 family)